MVGREDYEERKQARIDRLNGAAGKAAAASNDAYTRSHDLVKDIPFGQPNIVGRPALPNMRKKSAAAMDRALELDKKADYYAEKARAAEQNKAIFSDDPEALNKLREKLAELEAERERVKAKNREARKNGTEQSAWWVLPYLGKDIKRIKDRIAQLEQVDAMEDETIEFDGGEIESDSYTNRVMITFDEKPEKDTIDKLKRNGFRWAPSVGAWQRLRTPYALELACNICGVEK